MKTILKYIADDTTEHVTEQAAKDHNKLIKLAIWYEDNKLYGNYEGCRIEWDTLIRYIEQNTDKVSEIVRIIGETNETI